MKNTDFVWADLSTFDLNSAKSFYGELFGWRYQTQAGYTFAGHRARNAAGLFVMPQKFQAINIPSFWMSYIRVSDIQGVVARATAVNGIIEIHPTDFQGRGNMALMRDPSGAGFTVWQGSEINTKDARGGHGMMVNNELYVSDASLVMPFYETVFFWSFRRVSGYDGERYEVLNGAGKPIAALEVISNAVKGKAEYWAVYFSVKDLDHALQSVKRLKGDVIFQGASAEGRVAQVADPQGAVFCLSENPRASDGGQSSGGLGGLFKFRTFFGLGMVYMAVALNWEWTWGLLFLMWLVPDLRRGETYFVEPISRRENPVWYWLIMGSWIWMTVYVIVAAFYGG
ncbi:MAG: VOC family protein [Chloroflexota bacterium]